MITLNMINQYALENNIGDDTDIFTILSLMQLEYTKRSAKVCHTPPAPKVEWTTEDVLKLFST